ncbi:MAG: cbb3-type cytochrome c oxidase subunit I [gamma proteobacterium symbiont of Bathyaustriella thionipta]|nr:cbb3-type cytochrome c oxidase subunit I [gamma proteobacterium symbiont of Bathyaustriella thionipta]
MSINYSLPIPARPYNKLLIGWLCLGLGSLIVAGIFSILLVLSRTPQLQDMIPWLDFFHTALVVHVDMSVLIWFLSFASLLWSCGHKPAHQIAGWTALLTASAGALIIALAPFAGAALPLMNNYIPVLRHPLFYIGLCLFAGGISLHVLASLTRLPRFDSSLSVAAYSALLATAVALLLFLWAWLSVPQSLPDEAYFEFLFWGSGHVIQFTWSQLMLLAWVWLASAIGLRIGLSARSLTAIFLLGFSPVLLAPVIQAIHGADSAEYINGFRLLMRWGGGIAALPIGLMIILAACKNRQHLAPELKPLRNALYASVFLFGMGGVIGYLTHGINTIIPAHYHGAIVGVTLAFMGLSYYLLPRLGFAAPRGRLANWQPWVYAGGQLLHITGLGVAGAFGIQRKIAGGAQGLDSLPKMLFMGLMGVGGLIAIIGGMLFLLVAIRSMLQRQSRADAQQA